MKFVCDSCNTKYSIADERVHGRVLKIRCKTCDHVITVREEMKPPAAAPAAIADLGRNLNEQSGPHSVGNDEHTMVSTAPPPPATPEQADEWYVSFDGEQEGPMPLKRAHERVRAERPSGKEAHAWRPGFFVWLAVEEIPEFAPALERARKVSSPPPLPPATAPAISARPPSGTSQPVQKAPSVVKPAVAPMVGAPAAASAPAVARPPSLPAIGSSPEPLPPVDSKPLALPPPPEPLKDTPLNLPLPLVPAPMLAMDSSPSSTDSIPAGPMAMQLTRPEPRIARRALEADAAPAAQKAHDSSHESSPRPLIPPPPIASPAAAGVDREPSAPEISPFAAALAAATGQEQKHDTGPVPLPPPPGSEADLAISEPSGLLSIAHLAQAPMPRPSGDKAVIDTFGGVAVTPPGSNGTANAAPVVVVAGPAQGAAAWVKWSVAALLLLVVGLVGAVIYLVTQRPVAPPPQPATAAAAPNEHVNDAPIQLNEPAPPTSIGPAAPDPKKPAAAAHRASSSKNTAPAPASGQKPEKLSAEQQKLAALYGEGGGEKGTPREAATADRGEKAQGQVSQQSILAVVTQNRRALNLCYDRVLKHDSSLKRARLVTHVKVGLSGSVVAVTIPDPAYADSEIGQCLMQSIKRWHFPSADGEYETEFPIILQAE